ncbi:MAG: hypothetical protein WCO23_00830 [bacterium]
MSTIQQKIDKALENLRYLRAFALARNIEDQTEKNIAFFSVIDWLIKRSSFSDSHSWNLGLYFSNPDHWQLAEAAEALTSQMPNCIERIAAAILVSDRFIDQGKFSLSMARVVAAYSGEEKDRLLLYLFYKAIGEPDTEVPIEILTLLPQENIKRYLNELHQHNLKIGSFERCLETSAALGRTLSRDELGLILARQLDLGLINQARRTAFQSGRFLTLEELKTVCGQYVINCAEAEESRRCCFDIPLVYNAPDRNMSHDDTDKLYLYLIDLILRQHPHVDTIGPRNAEYLSRIIDGKEASAVAAAKLFDFCTSGQSDFSREYILSHRSSFTEDQIWRLLDRSRDHAWPEQILQIVYLLPQMSWGAEIDRLVSQYLWKERIDLAITLCQMTGRKLGLQEIQQKTKPLIENIDHLRGWVLTNISKMEPDDIKRWLLQRYIESANALGEEDMADKAQSLLDQIS